MAISNFIPELWSTQLLVAFRKSHVFNGLVNTNYQGEIRNAGDTVRITTPAAIGINNYSGSVVYETPTSTQQSLVIDQDRYWAFGIDDVDAVQANVPLMQAYMQEAAYALADNVDADLAGLYTAAGLDNIPFNLQGSGADDLYDVLVTAGKQLDEENVPRTGRWVVITPAAYANLLTNTKFTHATQVADQLIRTGQVGSVAGFTVFTSNNLVDASGGSDLSEIKYMYGTNAAITLATQVIMTEAVRRDAAFEDAVRGRLVYGRRVVRPAALGVITADES